MGQALHFTLTATNNSVIVHKNVGRGYLSGFMGNVRENRLEELLKKGASQGRLALEPLWTRTV
jgi:hypothetical protein